MSIANIDAISICDSISYWVDAMQVVSSIERINDDSYAYALTSLASTVDTRAKHGTVEPNPSTHNTGGRGQ
jgi:hypothetical protein